MCGLAGFWGRGEPAGAIAAAMANSLVHRGPDNGGIWCDAAAGLALAHRRLSIIDLSAAGAQPMISLAWGEPAGYSTPAYKSSVFSRTTTKSMFWYRDRTPA